MQSLRRSLFPAVDHRQDAIISYLLIDDGNGTSSEGLVLAARCYLNIISRGFMEADNLRPQSCPMLPAMVGACLISFGEFVINVTNTLPYRTTVWSRERYYVLLFGKQRSRLLLLLVAARVNNNVVQRHARDMRRSTAQSNTGT